MRMMHEDCDETARIARAREIEQGVDPPANFKTVQRVQLLCSDCESEDTQLQAPPRRLFGYIMSKVQTRPSGKNFFLCFVDT